MKNRYGRFIVKSDFFANRHHAQDGEIPGANLFYNMVVHRIEEHDWRGGKIYYAEHPDFEPIPPGMIPPRYEAVFLPGEVYPKWRLACDD